MNRRRSACVVGAGLSGLAVSLGLARSGWSVEVYERWPRVTAIGTGIGVWPSAMSVLDRLGVGAGLRAVSIPHPGGALMLADGTQAMRIDPERMRRRLGGQVVLLTRRRLVETLHAAALDAGVMVHVGCIPDVRASMREVDLVVGADGIGSTLRREVFDHPGHRRDSGFWAVRGTDARTVTPYGELWGDGALFGITPIEGGATNWYAAFRDDPDRKPDLDRVGRTYHGWAESVETLLKAAGPDDVLVHRVEHLWPVPNSYARDNAVLAGDAAHAMPPSLGHGGSESLVDAGTLVRLLDETTVGDALAAYDRVRRPPTRRYVLGSIAMARLTLASGAAARWRDRGLRRLVS